jgi:Tfp pilus assembly protein PilE
MNDQEQDRLLAELRAHCEQARAALVHLAETAETYKAELARTYHLEAEQIHLFVTDQETNITAHIPIFSYAGTSASLLVGPYIRDRKKDRTEGH